MLNIGPQELLLIFIVALLVVGPRRLPELGRSLGKGIRELRKAQDEVRKTIQVNLDEPARPDFGKRKVASHADAEGADALPDSDGVAAVTAAAAGAPAANDVGDISRSLGRGLAELRRTREEIQRSFRVEADRPAPRRRSAKPPASDRRGPPADTVASGDEDAEPAGPTDTSHPE
jgi:sec-independent protein translocase protein TatA